MMDPRWLVVERLGAAGIKQFENIIYSLPPLDDLDRELFKIEWICDQMKQIVRDTRAGERKSNIHLIFGSTLPPRDKN